MIELTDNKVKEFQMLYKKHFGKNIKYDEAKTDGLKLIQLVGLIQPRYEYGNKNYEKSQKAI